MTTSVPAQGGVHLMGSSCGQTQPGHVQAASKMTFSRADASFGAKKTVLLMIKWALHHSTMRSRARARVCVCVCVRVCVCVCVCVCVLSHFSPVQLFVTPWTIARQVPLSMGFSKQEYWSGLPCPLPGDFPDTGIKPRSPTLQANSL